MLDLALDRAEQRLTLPELTLDRGAGRHPVRRRAAPARCCACWRRRCRCCTSRRKCATWRRTSESCCPTRSTASMPAEHVVEARGAEQHREAGILAFGGVEVDQPRRELPLCPLQALPGDDEGVRVGGKIVLDSSQLDVGEVVGLDRPLQARVELLDLAEDALRLSAFGRDCGIRKCGYSSQRKSRNQCDDRCRRHSSRRAGGGLDARQAPSCEGPVRHKHGTLTRVSDDRKRRH